jgi:DNA mismatch repair protein MutL
LAVGTAAHAPIKVLPALVASQIAAGEVVERPASVVKELLDNALDAGARSITVELDTGGIELVKVADDGRGIPVADLPLALAPHATSKIAEASDLDRIATYGFRGEALASIASVSRLSIRTRTAQDVGATLLEAEGDTLRPPAPAAGPVGTAVTVRNLFFNTPARRKFLRTPATEQTRATDLFDQVAMAHPNVAFRLVADGRTTRDYPAGQTPRERVLAVLGSELDSQLIDAAGEDPGRAATPTTPAAMPATLWGVIGLPSLARATAQSQYVFINGRPVRDRTIQHAVKEAYRGLIEPGRYPTCALMIEMSPAEVDVNVHPAKVEVRFRDSSRVHALVFRTLRDTLQRADLTPAATGIGGAPGGGAPAGQTPWYGGPRAVLPGSVAAPLPAPPPGYATGAAGFASGQFVEYFQRPVPAGNGRLDFAALREALQGSPAEASRDAANAPAPPPGAGADADKSGAAATALPVPTPQRHAMQVHNAFLVTQDEHGMVIIDQHALHERVMFEKLLARVMGTPSAPGAPLESQALLTPAVVPAAPAQVDRLPDLEGLLKRLGIVAQPIGPASIAVHAFPSFLFSRGVEPGPFMAELLETAESTGFVPSSEEALHEVLDMMACKAAVKAGDRLSTGELRELLELRDAVERSSNCPHGRPTSIRVTIGELERRFGRT